MGSSHAPRVVGLMSGTSADGVDAVLLELPGFPAIGSGVDAPLLETLEIGVPRGRVLEHAYTPYPDDLRAAVLEACQLNARATVTTSGLTQLHFELGEFLAEAAKVLSSDADLISSHGQTVYHIPRVDEANGWYRRSTLQLGEPALIAEVTRKPVISDFRPADLVAGGQAAPLVPFADRVLFAQAGIRRAIHNLGGISNLTYLPGLQAEGVIAFDTGPANCLIDEAAALLNRRFDEGGALAASGRVEWGLLEVWARDPYLCLAPPKSTGREVWNLQRLQGVFELSPRDIVSSVTAFSARTVSEAYRRFVLGNGLSEIVVAGGGAYNPVLMDQIRSDLPGVPVLSFEDKGWHAFGFDATTREAAAFALLGYYAYQGWRNTLPHTTGARRAVIAGKLSRP